MCKKVLGYALGKFTNHSYKSGIAECKDAKWQDQSKNQIATDKITNNIGII